MHEEEVRYYIDLCSYRIEKAQEDLRTAKSNFDNEDYRAVNNRAYYSIFHSLRSVLALDHLVSKKHSGIIAEFRKKYIKNKLLPTAISAMIDSAFEIRNASDYNDLFIASKNETKQQITHAEYILKEVMKYIGPQISSYQKIFEEQETNTDSQAIYMILVSLFSSDTLLTIYDCGRSEKELLKLKWALDDANISDDMKGYWKDRIFDGLDICRRDRNEMRQ